MQKRYKNDTKTIENTTIEVCYGRDVSMVVDCLPDHLGITARDVGEFPRA